MTEQTMDDEYGDGSDHIVCKVCGMCITCGDCDKYGCNNKTRTQDDKPTVDR